MDNDQGTTVQGVKDPGATHQGRTTNGRL
jgi:hypothetical protein